MIKKILGPVAYLVFILSVALGLHAMQAAIASSRPNVECQGTGVTQFTASGKVSLANWLKRNDNSLTTVLDYSMHCGKDGFSKSFADYLDDMKFHAKMIKGTVFWGIKLPGYPG